MRFILVERVGDVSLEFVVDAAGFARVTGGRLQRHRRRRVGRHLEEKRKRVRTQLFDETLLKTRQRARIRLHLREN